MFIQEAIMHRDSQGFIARESWVDKDYQLDKAVMVADTPTNCLLIMRDWPQHLAHWCPSRWDLRANDWEIVKAATIEKWRADNGKRAP